MQLSFVVILTEIAYLLSILVKIVRTLHHFELVTRVKLLNTLSLGLTPIRVLPTCTGISVRRVRHCAKLELQSATDLLKVGQEGGQVGMITDHFAQVLHRRAQLHHVGVDVVRVAHLLRLEMLDLVLTHLQTLTVEFFRLFVLLEQVFA